MDNYLTSLEPPSWALIFILLIGVYIPGYVLTYIFAPILFFKLDWFKLSVIALSIPTPLVLINSFLFAWKYVPLFEIFGNGNYASTLIALFSSVVSSVVLYTLLGILFFTKLNMITALKTTFIIELIVSIPIIFFGMVITRTIDEFKKGLKK
jgi:hypothetical protein